MKQTTGIHDGHRKRVKDKFDKVGLASFADHEILELLLFYSVPYKDTNPLAHKLINHFGSLQDVLAADKDALLEVDGITENSAILICLVQSLVSEVSKRSMKSREILGGFSASIEFAKQLFAGEQVEKMYMILLDRKNQVKGTKLVASGSSTSAHIDTKMLAKHVLQKNIDRIILAHNHPIGTSAPSAEDLNFTNSIVATLKPLGIEILDHIIVAGDGTATSLAHEGFLSGQRPAFVPLAKITKKQ